MNDDAAEAIEYRIKRNRQVMALHAALVCILTAMLSFSVASVAVRAGQDASLPFLAGLVCLSFGAFVLVINQAVSSDGIARRVLSHITSFDDPPLNDWGDDLERRGSFHGGDDE